MRETGFCGTLLTAPTSKLPLKEKPQWQEFRQFRVGDKVLDGEPSRQIYVLCHGWAFRYKKLSDGRRQIFNFLLYFPYATTRKSPGEMTRKLSVIRSRKNAQLFGIVDLRNFRMARLKSRKVGWSRLWVT